MTTIYAIGRLLAGTLAVLALCIVGLAQARTPAAREFASHLLRGVVIACALLASAFVGVVVAAGA